ncbi:MAG: M16 family metallopeptidase [Candidatus Krumholzibacteriia bacterium]
MKDMIRMTAGLAVAALVVLGQAGCTREAGPLSTKPVRTELESGITLLVQPIAGAERVGVEFLYRVGFLDEPENRPQLAHLMEHLACKSSTGSHRAGESWNWLQENGTVNAETLPTYTHYDYGVAVGDLERVLEIEADRMQSLQLDTEVTEREASYCYAEIANLEKHESAPMIKFATMAAHQAWRFGSNAVTLASGLETIPEEEIAAFYRTHYHPRNLVIAITGGVSAERALALVRESFDDLGLPEPGRIRPTDWSGLPPVAEVTWDSPVSAVFVWFEPPGDELERRVLSLWGNLARLHLVQDVEISAVARFVMAPSHVWPVGRLPFFVYASVAEGYTARQVHRAIGDRLEEIARKMVEGDGAAQLQSLVRQLELQGTLGKKSVDAQMQFLTEQRGMEEDRARDQVFLQHSINAGVRDGFFGGDVTAGIEELKRVDEAQLRSILERALDETKRHVTVLNPAGAGR